MLRLEETRAAVVCCLAERDLLDSFPPVEAHACRVAGDELLLLGAPDAAEELLRAAYAHLASESIIVEHGDAYAIWTLSGSEFEHAVRRLMAVPVPEARPAFVQGAFAHVPGRLLFLDECVHVLVPANVAHHVRERILADCADLELQEVHDAVRTAVRT